MDAGAGIIHSAELPLGVLSEHPHHVCCNAVAVGLQAQNIRSVKFSLLEVCAQHGLPGCARLLCWLMQRTVVGGRRIL